MNNKTRIELDEQYQQWYAGVTAGNNGLAIEEGTGRTVALTYDIKDRFLVAAAPEMQNALIAVDEFLVGFKTDELPDGLRRMVSSALSNSKKV